MHSIITSPSAKQDSQPDSFQKGQMFENYIINLFNQRSFDLKAYHKSERIPDGSYSPENNFPDLELVFMGKRKHRFAVECKWRKYFWYGKIKWATDYQICCYEDFQNRMRVPVFIAIGIGGEPSNPEKLFVTPLNNISNYTHVYETDLIPYKRKPTHRFFYDTHQLKLF